MKIFLFILFFFFTPLNQTFAQDQSVLSVTKNSTVKRIASTIDTRTDNSLYRIIDQEMGNIIYIFNVKDKNNNEQYIMEVVPAGLSLSK